MDEHQKWVRRCLQLARLAADSNESPVGTVIVREGALLAEGSERVKAVFDVGGHAELIAVREACQLLGHFDLSDGTLYTTAEPCFLCSYAIRATRVARVFVGRPVAEVGGVTSRFPILTDPAFACWGPPPAVEFLPALVFSRPGS